MGNCLVIEDQIIRVVKPDGKILEYRSPIRALDVMSKFTGHEISETMSYNNNSIANSIVTPAIQKSYLRPEAKLRRGNMYYLVAITKAREGDSVKIKKRVRFSEPEKEYLVKEDHQEKATNNSNSKVVRIKVIISKQELQELLKKEGISVADVASHIQASEKRILSSENNTSHDDDDDHDWKPVLESIPELN